MSKRHALTTPSSFNLAQQAFGQLSRGIAAWATVLALLLAGCGGGGADETSAGASATNNPTATDTATASPVVAAEAPATEAVAANATSGSDAAAALQAELAAASAASAATAAVNAEAAAASLTEKTTASATQLKLADVPVSITPALATPVVVQTASSGTAVPLIVRARADLAAGVGPQMEVRVNGNVIGSVAVKSTNFTDYSFSTSTLATGAKIDIVYTNDATVIGEDRNLYLAYIAQGSQVLMPTDTNSTYDRGVGSKAFDGLDILAGQTAMYWNGALRLTWPTSALAADTQQARSKDAVRFLLQASFGPTSATVSELASKPYATWLNEQMALPAKPDYVNFVQAKYNLGDAYRPKGANYTPSWVGQAFWSTVANAPDQLRKRVAFALHQIFMVSQADSNLYYNGRAYASYLDKLNQNAFGNYRTLLEDIALSPAMGIYLSHMRNRKEDAATGRMPDENFAREIMQLFSIGLVELNADGTAKLDNSGNAIETYSNADVMALAKVFTGWSWAFADSELTESKFRWSSPDTSAAGDQRIDLLPMKAYPGQHSSAAKPLFAGKAWATSIAAGGTAQADLKQALDVLFNHPNVGPFIGRQLIQRLVTSQPSPAYVARVAMVFNNNGSGVRGDLAAVVRTILLDAEARNAPPAGFGKLREPVLRVAHWMRALGAKSGSGQYMLAWELDGTGQRAFDASSVFGYFRAGYVPPNTSFAAGKSTAPEFQIVNESTVAAWINTAEAMAGNGLGWNGSANDVAVDHAALGAMADSGNLGALLDHLNLLLLGGRMSPTLRQAILDTTGQVGQGPTAAAYRARAAVFLVLASPEFLTQP